MKHNSNKWLLRMLTAALALVLLMTSVPVDLAAAAGNVNMPLKITTSGLTYPTTITKGNSFSLKGTVEANYGKITKVTAVITNRKNGKTVMTASSSPNNRTVNLRSTINKKLTFGKLAAGNYRLKVTATAQYKSKKTTRTIINRAFTVKSSSPELVLNWPQYPTSLNKGNRAVVRGVISTKSGTITNVWVYVLDSNKKRVMSSYHTPNKSYFDLYTHVSNDMLFGALPVGEYTFVVKAKAVNGKSYTTKTLVSSKLTIK